MPTNSTNLGSPVEGKKATSLLAEAQAKHPNRKVVELLLKSEDGTQETAVVVLVPDRKETLDYLTMADKDMYRAQTRLLNSCVVEGKEALLANDEFFMAASAAVMSLVKVGTYEIKKP